MTNEKKIKSLWYHFCTEKHCAEITQNCQICPKAQVHPQLLEIAEWKDEQFKTKIEELFNALEKEGYNDRVKSGFEIFKDKIIKL